MAYLPHHSNQLSDAERLQLAREAVNALCKEAKQLSLSAYFEQHSGTECKFRNGKHHSTWCPYCGESSKGNSKIHIDDDMVWHCMACEEGGTIIDADIFQFGGTPREAAERLLGRSHEDFEAGRMPVLRHQESNEKKLQRMEQERQKYAAVAKVVRAVCRATKDLREKAVIDYLVQERKIPETIVEDAIRRNLLRTLPVKPAIASALIRSIVPEETLRAAGLWGEDAEVPWIVYRPLWFIMPYGRSAELRIIKVRKGDKKSLRIGRSPDPYFWYGECPENCAAVEGFLDLLALAALNYDGDIMGLPGVNTWEIDWFKKLPSIRGTKQYDIMFDNDVNPDSVTNEGQDAAERLGATLSENRLPYTNHVPPAGDVNDYLIALTKHSKIDSP